MRRRGKVLIVASLLLLLSGCGDDKAGSIVTSTYYNPAAAATEEAEVTERQENVAERGSQVSNDQFLILQNDSQSECLVLEQIASGKQYMYNYSLTTDFLDKYGNRCSISQFDPGRVITIGDKDSKGRITQAQISDQVWEYPDVTRYEVDEERGVFRIAENSYSFDGDLYLNSDGRTITWSDLTDLDAIRVIGCGTELISVTVTTGHGELSLKNTDLFEGSYIQIGERIFERITPNMTIEVPEGTYTVAVANKGYGGSTDVTIVRGEKETLDLDTIKGDGPKIGSILFAVDVADAMLVIDGNLIDYSEPVELTYGVHSLVCNATGYDTYSKKLVVNSSEATIVIGMDASSTTSSSSSDTTSSDETTSDSTTTDSSTASSSTATAGSLAGSLAGSSSSGSSSSSSTLGSIDEATLDAMVDELLGNDDSSSSSDYLSTLTSLLSSITGSSD